MYSGLALVITKLLYISAVTGAINFEGLVLQRLTSSRVVYNAFRVATETAA